VDSIRSQEPDELLVVADAIESADFPFLNVAPITRTTIDALVKRDVGTVATKSANICYLSDDHKLGHDFVRNFKEKYVSEPWDLLAPSRYTIRGQKIYPLNVGEREGYIGGHCGIYRRKTIQKLPWSASPHHPNWDLLHSHLLTRQGLVLQYARADLAVEDIEPGASPWL